MADVKKYHYTSTHTHNRASQFLSQCHCVNLFVYLCSIALSLIPSILFLKGCLIASFLSEEIAWTSRKGPKSPQID